MMFPNKPSNLLVLQYIQPTLQVLTSLLQVRWQTLFRATRQLLKRQNQKASVTSRIPRNICCGICWGKAKRDGIWQADIFNDPAHHCLVWENTLTFSQNVKRGLQGGAARRGQGQATRWQIFILHYCPLPFFDLPLGISLFCNLECFLVILSPPNYKNRNKKDWCLSVW